MVCQDYFSMEYWSIPIHKIVILQWRSFFPQGDRFSMEYWSIVQNFKHFPVADNIIVIDNGLSCKESSMNPTKGKKLAVNLLWALSCSIILVHLNAFRKHSWTLPGKGWAFFRLQAVVTIYFQLWQKVSRDYIHVAYLGCALSIKACG